MTEPNIHPRPNIRSLDRPFDYQTDDFSAVWKEMDEAAPRAAAIMAGAFVEDALQWAIEGFFDRGLTSEEKIRVFEGGGAPLGSFYSKIVIGHALGLYGPIVRSDLHIIRQIRNAFAHSPRSVTFEMPEIVSECEKFRYLRTVRNPTKKTSVTAPQNPPSLHPRRGFFDTVKIIHLGLHAAWVRYPELDSLP